MIVSSLQVKEFRNELFFMPLNCSLGSYQESVHEPVEVKNPGIFGWLVESEELKFTLKE